MKKRNAFYAIALAAGLCGALAAYSYSMPEKDTAAPGLKGAFCPALSQEAVYKKNNLWQYRILVQGRDNWIFRTDNDFNMPEPVTPQTLASLLAVQKAFKAKNIDLVIAFPPMRGLVHSAHLSQSDLEKYGLKDRDKLWTQYEQQIADLQNAGLNIVGVNRNETGLDFYYQKNHHWTASGASKMAQKIADFIQAKLPAYQNIPRVSYTTLDKGTVPYDSSFEKVFEQICHTQVPPDSAHVYETSTTTETPSSDALFGDAAPQVVLLGTSNSVNESSLANFEGFLKEDLKADIYNMAFIGAGIDSSIISFLNSPFYKNGSTKIAIWEVPAYYDFNNMDDLYRQIIPAVYGDCGTSAVLDRTITGIPAGRRTLFQEPKDEAIAEATSDITDLPPQTDYYIKLSFSKPVSQNITLKFFDEVAVHKQEFERSDRYPYDNTFYFMFSTGQDETALQKISIEIPPGMEGTDLEARVCALPPGNSSI